MDWTTEEQNDVLQFYGLDTLTPTEWVDRNRDVNSTLLSMQPTKSAIKGEASNEQILSSLQSLDTARQLLRDDYDPLDLKDTLIMRQLILSRNVKPDINGGEESSLSQLDLPITGSIIITLQNFDARLFLRVAHLDTSYIDLVKGRQNLQKATLQRNESLKNLVKQNFDRFVNAKNSTEAVFQDMRQRRLTDQDHGMRKAIEAVSVAFQRAQDIYGSLMTRREQESKIRRKLEIFNRYTFIFSLGYRLEQSMKIGEYQAAVFDYRRAKTMMNDATNVTLKNLLQKTWTGHVDKILTKLRDELYLKLSNPVFTYDVHSKLIDYLVELDVHPDPVISFFNNRKSDIFDQCQRSLVKSIGEMKRIIPDIETAAIPRIILSMVQSRKSNKIGLLQVDIVRCWKIRVSFLYSLVDTFTKFYADFGKFINALLIGRFCHDKGQRATEINSYELRIQDFAEEFTTLLPQLLEQILSKQITKDIGIQDNSIVAIHYALKSINRMIELRTLVLDLKPPLSIIKATQLVLEQYGSIFLSSAWDSASDDCAKLPSFETWQVSGEGFDYSTVLVKGFESLITTLIDGSATIMKNIHDAIIDDPTEVIMNDDPLVNLDERLSNAICAFLNSLCDLVLTTKSSDQDNPDHIVAAVDSQRETITLENLGASYKLLTVLSNIQYLRQVAIPHILDTYSSVGSFGQISEETKQTIISTMDRSEDLIKQRFLEDKRHRLIALIRNGTIKSGLDWMDNRHPQMLRPYIQTILLELVAVQTQIYDVSSSILRPLMSQLVLDIFQEFLRCIRMIRDFGLGGYMLLRSEVSFLQHKLITIMDQEGLELYETIIKTLDSCKTMDLHDCKREMDQLVHIADKDSNIAFSCFQYT